MQIFSNWSWINVEHYFWRVKTRSVREDKKTWLTPQLNTDWHFSFLCDLLIGSCSVIQMSISSKSENNNNVLYKTKTQNDSKVQTQVWRLTVIYCTNINSNSWEVSHFYFTTAPQKTLYTHCTHQGLLHKKFIITPVCWLGLHSAASICVL